ncbi:MAG: PEGA domain-containing protein, partial [Acidobacteria bacterium]|nr:PEGA domain-containing protein [Acidobacteriota bacterium]
RYGGHGYGQYYPSDRSYGDHGQLRLKVKPRDAQVLVNGYFVGRVDDFDGVFQRLTLETGGHRVEIRAPGYAPLVFEVMILLGETVTYRGELLRLP